MNNGLSYLLLEYKHFESKNETIRSQISLTLNTHAQPCKKKKLEFNVRESVSIEGKRKSELLPQFAFSFCAQFGLKVEPMY